ncbi:MAG: YeeE/YedE family protein [Bacteroidota bacterium]|nr:YeeE/YedE family protein [Bacteroidota bacterium]
MIEFLKQPWPWYVSGPLIGLMVPALLIFGNKTFGVSSSLRHICAIGLPARIPYFNYDWKKEGWNLFFVLGIVVGGFICALYLSNPAPIQLNPKLVSELSGYGISDLHSQVPTQLFTWSQLLTVRGFIFMVVGGFLVGFGTRYAGGCTSGHSIMGISNLQVPSLIATCCFMAGGFVMANLIEPYLLKL